ncbi:MAG TPA: DinB family protein [Gemmatimonadales bacterium]|jgi:uncharacterized damage-inducible protein DinB
MTTTTLTRPSETEYAPVYARYVARIPEGDIVSILDEQMHASAELLDGLSESQGDYRYAPGKWSIKEVVSHVADAERVFAYRALWFSRGDENELPGFDEQGWVPNSGAASRALRDVADELRAVRLATIAFARSVSEEQSLRSGVASGYRVTVRGLLYIIAGHEAHHVAILRERYLK